MMDEPNARNGHGELEETQLSAPFSPETETLAMRLAADGAIWRNSVPDPTRVAERIRAIPLLSPQTTHEDSHETTRKGDSRMSVGANRPSNEDSSFTEWAPEPGPSRPWGRILGLVAAAVVVALLATVLAQLAAQRGATTGPAALPTRVGQSQTGSPSSTTAPVPPTSVFLSASAPGISPITHGDVPIRSGTTVTLTVVPDHPLTPFQTFTMGIYAHDPNGFSELKYCTYPDTSACSYVVSYSSAEATDYTKGTHTFTAFLGNIGGAILNTSQDITISWSQ
jgi:hypothetical protein